MPTYPAATQLSNTYHVQVKTVDLTSIPDAQGQRLPIMEVHERSHVFNPYLQKQLLSEYNMKCKLKLQE